MTLGQTWTTYARLEDFPSYGQGRCKPLHALRCIDLLLCRLCNHNTPAYIKNLEFLHFVGPSPPGGHAKPFFIFHFSFFFFLRWGKINLLRRSILFIVLRLSFSNLFQRFTLGLIAVISKCGPCMISDGKQGFATHWGIHIDRTSKIINIINDPVWTKRRRSTSQSVLGFPHIFFSIAHYDSHVCHLHHIVKHNFYLFNVCCFANGCCYSIAICSLRQ